MRNKMSFITSSIAIRRTPRGQPRPVAKKRRLGLFGHLLGGYRPRVVFLAALLGVRLRGIVARRARRHLWKRFGAPASRLLDAFHHSRSAATMLRCIAGVARFRLPLVTQLMLFGLRLWIIMTVAVHLAAGEHLRGLTAVRVLNALFRRDVRARRIPTAIVYFQTLYGLRLYDRIVREVPEFEAVESAWLARLFGRAHTFRLNADIARSFLALFEGTSPFDAQVLFERGDALLVAGAYDEAAVLFHAATTAYPNVVMAHQNLAARYNVSAYRPVRWELEQAGTLKIYDRLGQIAEEIFLSGDMEKSFYMYGRLLDYQTHLANGFCLPENVRQLLALECANFDPTLPVRLLPYEWVTQFGHIGLLDSYMKMVRLASSGPANHVLLAPAGKVANSKYLSYWDNYFCVVEDEQTVNALFPYQRQLGQGFMALPSPARMAEPRMAEPWAHAAACAQIAWARQKRPPLLRLTDLDRAFGRYALKQMGIPEDAWFVALHVREGGYYAEGSTSANAHRNASIEDYLPGVKEITDRGGYVIRLGDHTMKPFPPMDRVIDYAHSALKSPTLDLVILATSRFVVGTTSGLTNVALSFGTPMVLVNCISSDWQIWTDQVDFILKKVHDRHKGRLLSLAELCSLPILGQLINNMAMHLAGYTVQANTAEEIRAAIAYKTEVALGLRRRADENDPIIRQYRQAIAHTPYIFGAARPVPTFIAANPYLVSPDAAPLTADPWDGPATAWATSVEAA